MKSMLMIKLASLFCLAFIVGCGSAGVKKTLSDEEVKPELVDTTPYLPVQTYDEKTASFLPYEASENPYLAIKGRIDKNVVTKFIQARRLFKSGKYSQTKTVLAEIIALDKKLSGPWVMRGDVAMMENRYEDAVALYRKSIETNKNNVNAYLKMAKTQRMLGQFIEAQNTYSQALAIWSDFPEAHLNLGVLYDIYLNHPLRAQKHMQAYQFLSGGKNKQVAAWITEIQDRTGVKTSLTTQK